jgi:glycerophosphoryl diester phosphodiesterase
VTPTPEPLLHTHWQVRQLRATQRLPFRNQSFNGLYAIPTFEEYLDLALQAGRPVGVYPGALSA